MMNGDAPSGMTGEVIALIVIAIFQAFQTMLMAMGTFILKDVRDRVSRLEDIEMGAVKERDGHR